MPTDRRQPHDLRGHGKSKVSGFSEGRSPDREVSSRSSYIGSLGGEQSRFHVSRPHIQWHDKQGSEFDLTWLPKMRTDLVLESSQRRIIIDTKYYAKAFQHSFRKKKVRSAHLYQMFAYVENRDASEPHGAPHEGMLLYPAVEASFVFDYRLNGHRIQVRSIDLAQSWPQIKAGLLGLVDPSEASLCAIHAS